MTIWHKGHMPPGSSICMTCVYIIYISLNFNFKDGKIVCSIKITLHSIFLYGRINIVTSIFYKVRLIL